MKRVEQNCPLCLGNATYADFDYGHRKAFHCNTCREYVLTSIAERMLSNPPGLKEHQLSELVRNAAADLIAEIRSENNPSGGKMISVKWLSRASAMLP